MLKALHKVPDLLVKKISDRLQKGVADLIICYKGRYVAIELKVGNNKPTALQSEFLEEVKKAGGFSGVAYTVAEVKAILRGVHPCEELAEVSVCETPVQSGRVSRRRG